MSVSAGRAYLDILPRLHRAFSQTLTREMFGPATRSADKTGRESGQRFGRGFSEGTKRGTRPAVGVFRALRGEMSNALSGRAAAAFGGAIIAAGLNKTVQAASDLNETMSKTRVVFGPAAGIVEKFGQTAARSLGLSRQEALEATATLGNLFVSMKIGQQPAAQMSTKMVQLASDLASFNNADPSEVLEALRAGLVGETEPLRRFGINLNDASLKAEAMRLGLGKVGPTLTASQRAQAAYSLILQQSKTAQGDFARTSGGLANQQRILAAEFKDAQAALGEQLLPAMLSGVRVINRLLDAFGTLNRATGGFAAKGLLAGAGLTAVAVGVGKILGPLKEVRGAWVGYRTATLTAAAADAVLTRQQILLGLSTTTAGNAAQTAGAKFAIFGKLSVASLGAYAAAAAAAAYQGHSLADAFTKGTQVSGPFAEQRAKILRLLGIEATTTKELTGAQKGANQATQAGKAAGDAYAGALAALGGKQADTSAKTDELRGKLRELREGFRSQVQSVRESIESYDGLIHKSGVTAKEVIGDLHNQVINFGVYSRDVRRLIKAGVDPKAIQELSQKGPQYVHALATGSNRQLLLYKKFWQDRQSEIRGNFARSMQGQYADLVRKMQAMQREINKLKGKTVTVSALAKVVLGESTRLYLRAAQVPGFHAKGAKIPGYGGGDIYPAMLEPGEAVVPKERARRPEFRAWANRMGIPGFQRGGVVGDFDLSPWNTKVAQATERLGQRLATRLAGSIGRGLSKAIERGIGALGGGIGGAVGPRISGPVANIVRGVASRYGWGSGSQWAALAWIINHESGFNPNAQNPTSTAYGLFQFLNGTWAGVGGHKTSDPYLQSVYGLKYIASRYGSPLGAQAFWQSHGWYDRGGWLQPGTTVAVNRTGRPERVVPPGPQVVVLDPASARLVADHVVRGLHSTPLIVQIDGTQVRTAARSSQRRSGVPAAQQIR